MRFKMFEQYVSRVSQIDAEIKKLQAEKKQLFGEAATFAKWKVGTRLIDKYDKKQYVITVVQADFIPLQIAYTYAKLTKDGRPAKTGTDWGFEHRLEGLFDIQEGA